MLRLVGRRPDAPLVFADAGRRAARYAARVASPGRPGPWRVVGRAGSPGGSPSARRRTWPAGPSAASCAPAPDGVEVRMARPALGQGAARRVGLRLLRRGLRRAAAAAHRVRGGDAARALPRAGRRRLHLAERGGGDLRVGCGVPRDRMTRRRVPADLLTALSRLPSLDFPHIRTTGRQPSHAAFHRATGSVSESYVRHRNVTMSGDVLLDTQFCWLHIIEPTGPRSPHSPGVASDITVPSMHMNIPQLSHPAAGH